MSNRGLRLGLGAVTLVLAIAGIAAYMLFGRGVPIKTGTLTPDASPGFFSCYTSGTGGELVTDPDTGTAIIEGNGRRVAVTWPLGWTGRSSGAEVEILDSSGKVVARTGTQVSLMGGYWYDGSFLTCGPIPSP
jgi:hypothetical protein